MEEKGENVPDQKGKLTKKPTMRWIFQQFEGIHVLEERKERGEAVIKMLNLRKVHKKILSLLGPTYEKIYLCPT